MSSVRELGANRVYFPPSGHDRMTPYGCRFVNDPHIVQGVTFLLVHGPPCVSNVSTAVVV